MVTGSYPPMRCGVGDYTERLVNALGREAGVETSVLTSRLGEGPAEEGGVVRAMSSWNSRALRDFRRQASRFKPDAVHIQFPTQGYDFVNGLVAMAAYARFRLRVPLVVTLHEYLPRFHAGIYALALLASKIVVVRPEYYGRIPAPWKPLIRRSKIAFVANASAVPSYALSAEQLAVVRRELGSGSASIVAFFGFSYPHKGVDLLFEIADPQRHHLLLIGELSRSNPYHRQLLELAESAKWRGKVTVTGFIGPDDAARMLAAADAVVFPYRNGGGVWNSSLHAAMSQDTFVLITSQERRGYDSAANVYFARPDDLDEMRRALLEHQSTRRSRGSSPQALWRDIADTHREIYFSLAGRPT